MGMTPKRIIDGLAGVLRREKAGERPRPSGSPSTVGAPKPGEPRGHKSATAPTRPKAKPAPPAKPGATSKTGEV
jgi:hypothetical protein